MNELLVITDLQNDFLPFGIKPQGDLTEMCRVIHAQMEAYDWVVATQLWYPAKHIRFAANHPWRHPDQVIEIEGMPQRLFEYSTVQDTFGAQLISQLDTSRIEQVFQRGRLEQYDSYSVFFDTQQYSTGLFDFVQQYQIQAITLVGVNHLSTFERSVEDGERLGLYMSVLEF